MDTGNTVKKLSRGYQSLMLLFLAASCGQMKNERMVSPGRVKKELLEEHIDTFSRISNEINIKPVNKYEVIGHGAGSWRYYPMGVNKKGMVYGNGFDYKKTPALKVTDLMDTSMAIDPAMSMEIDAQYPPKDHIIRTKYPNDGAYIMHDIPKWEKPWMKESTALDYLHQNTVKEAVDHFVQKAYYQECKLYIEIKVNKDCYGSESREGDCIKHCPMLADELNSYASCYNRTSGENWLCITSFSPVALEIFRNSLSEEVRDHFDYILILGYTVGWPKSWFAQSKGYVPELDSTISNFVVQTAWLDGVWFSAQGIPDFNSRLNDLRSKRVAAHPGWKELGFSFSTYQLKEEKMKALMTKTPKLNVSIRSFMLDLDYDIPSR